MNKEQILKRLAEIREMMEDEEKRGDTSFVELEKEVRSLKEQLAEIEAQERMKEKLEDDDQRFLWSHDSSKVLGRTKNGTLRLKEDDVGLRVELDLPNTTLGNDTYETIKRGDVDGMSFGFKVESDEVHEPDDDLPLRTITKARLFEVSAVAFPAYPDSEVSARGYDRMKDYDKELKKHEEEQRAKINILLNL